MIGRATGWTVLALLAASAALIGAQVDMLVIDSMVWSYGDILPRTTLTVCAAEGTDYGDTWSLVAYNVDDGQQTDYGQGDNSDVSTPNCADFSVDVHQDVPSVQTEYELKTSDSTGVPTARSGTVTYAFPGGVTFVCGANTFWRFTVADSSTVDQWTCNAGLSAVCYASTMTAGCLTGLDSSYPDFQVCVPALVSSVTATGLTTTALAYPDGTFTYTPGSANTLSDLLLTVQGSTSFAPCVGFDCTLADFTQGTDNYELCAAFIDGNGDLIEAEAASLQDLDLNVDRVGTSNVVDFHFKNMNSAKTYDITSDAPGASGTPFTLDCNSIAIEETCNGFVDFGAPPDTGGSITVAYTGGTNQVNAPFAEI